MRKLLFVSEVNTCVRGELVASVTHLLTFGDDVGANIMQYLGTREDIELQSLTLYVSQYFLRNFISSQSLILVE